MDRAFRLCSITIPEFFIPTMVPQSGPWLLGAIQAGLCTLALRLRPLTLRVGVCSVCSVSLWSETHSIGIVNIQLC
jgi:hypothetical protein